MTVLGIHFNLRSSVLLLSAPILLSLYYYHGIPGDEQWLAGQATPASGDLVQRYIQFVLFAVLAGVIPWLCIRFVFKEPVIDFGIGWGEWKKWLPITLALILLIVAPMMWFAARIPDVKSEYPLARVLFEQDNLFWQYEAMYIVFYYIAWEFFFRGFLLFGLAKEFGAAPAILIQTISSCLIHIGKPEGETLGAVVVGILFGILALRSKSIWYGWLLHISIGVITDYFVLYQAGIKIG